MEGSTTSTLNKDPKDQVSQESLIGVNWPSLPVPANSQNSQEKQEDQESQIQPGQKTPKTIPWKSQQRGPDDYERDRVGKYAQYFKGNEILPIPEIVEQLEPRILSLVVSDIKTKRLVGLKKEIFEDLLRKAGIPCQYFCRKSFATWDVLLPTEEQAAKAAATNIMTKNFRLQPEYKGTRRLRVTVCNVPAYISGEFLASYLSAYGKVEEINLLRSPAGTAYGDYTFRLCLTRDGFKAIPETLISGDRQMMVMVEGRRPRCWGCKQIGHIAKFCPQKTEGSDKSAVPTTTATTDTTATTSTISKKAEVQGPGQVQPKTNNQEGWTEVTRKRRGSPKQGETGTTSPPPKQTTPAPPPGKKPVSTPEPKPRKPAVPESPATSTPSPATQTTIASSASPKKTKKKKVEQTPMETSTNLKKEKGQRGRGRQKMMPRTT